MKSSKQSTDASQFYKKWWMWAIILTIVFGLASCGNDTEPLDNTESTTENTATEEIATSEPAATDPVVVNEYAVVEKFIELYNAASTNPAADLVQMDIHGEDYSTEFRLNAFKDAVGLKGSISSGTIRVVNYGPWSNDSIRVYAVLDNYDSAIELYTNIVHILDSTIADDEISDQYAGFSYTGTASIYLGSAGYISGFIETSYANGGIDGYEIMVDCSKINFME